MASVSASADAAGAGKTSSRLIPGRRVGMRIWLGAAFAGVTLITAFAVYIFVDDSSGRTLQSESGDLAVGRTTSVADQIAEAEKGEAARILDDANSETFQVWAINRRGGPFAPLANPPADLRTVEQAGQAGEAGRAGRRFRADLSEDRTLASAPIFGQQGVRGTIVGVAEPPPALTRAFDDLQGDRVRAIMIAIVVGVLVGLRRLHADRDPGQAPCAQRRTDGGRKVRRPAAAGRQRRDRRPDQVPRHDARGAARQLRPARHRARPPLGHPRRAARGR